MPHRENGGITIMSLLNDVSQLWVKNRSSIEAQIGGWVDEVNNKRALISEARKSFHEWTPLRVYLSLSSAKKTGAKAVFSLRFLGQDVAKVKVKGNSVTLDTSKYATSNLKHFDLKLGAYRGDWRSTEAKAFRKHFVGKAKSSSIIKTAVPEHQVESNLLKEMSKGSKYKKFSGRFSGIQPVLSAGCPFQVPLPISGNTGVPVLGKGNIDILARRKGAAKLSVWEIKRPRVPSNNIKNAISQVIIYSATLLLMLRSRHGEKWYKLLGFSGSRPQRLKVEAIVSISSRQKALFHRYIREFESDFPLRLGADSIILGLACYDDKYEIESFELT